MRNLAGPGLRALGEYGREACGEAPITEPASAEIADM